MRQGLERTQKIVVPDASEGLLPAYLHRTMQVAFLRFGEQPGVNLTVHGRVVPSGFDLHDVGGTPVQGLQGRSFRRCEELGQVGYAFRQAGQVPEHAGTGFQRCRNMVMTPAGRPQMDPKTLPQEIPQILPVLPELRRREFPAAAVRMHGQGMLQEIIDGQPDIVLEGDSNQPERRPAERQRIP